ncbi:emerin-like [Takifugu flavidus]|uniref:LEM domain-containing protein n=1 Tax=Takifugu flavidus TaxID=433684 RepID=A0A5C6MQ74_9TELE|nr:emerin-like [Takifugu flavidus]TWW56558.1 hypothetical protein D4764_08G0005450 [Takifugu flavidus]
MSSLTNMSADELSKLLDEYGIKHGPVVDSTRGLYERKLNEAMSKTKGVKPASDKTFYREEEEEVTYVYRSPARDEETSDSGAYMRSRPYLPERGFEQHSSYSSYSRATPEYRANDFANQSYTYETPSTYKNTYSTSATVKSAEETKKPPQSSRLIPVWVQIVLFLAVAVFFYMIFASMETNESFEGLE